MTLITLFDNILLGEMMKPKYSFVVPIFNEEANIMKFFKELKQTMDNLQEDYEIVFVDDGSRDNSLKVLKQLANVDKNVKIVSLTRNFGKKSAIFCGLKKSLGQAVIVLSADLQQPIETIPKMIEKWKEGYNIVHGRIKNVNCIKKAALKIFAWATKLISGFKIPALTDDFKLLDRAVVDEICAMSESEFSLRCAAAFVGRKQTFVDYERRVRYEGKNKRSSISKLKNAGREISSISTFPLSLASIAGVAFSVVSTIAFTTFIILAGNKIYLPLAAWLFPTITCCFAFLFSIMGFNNMYLRRMYVESLNRPKYIINEEINLDN